MPSVERCVAHPSRPAVDRCPTCDRPRCGADTGPTCQVCHGVTTVLTARPPRLLERLVRAALGSFALALPGGLIASEYVDAPSAFLPYLAPVVVGIAVGAAATAAAGEPRGRQLTHVRQVAVVYAVLAQALGIRLEGSFDVWSPDRHVLLPYVVSAVACWLWSAPPRQGRGTRTK